MLFELTHLIDALPGSAWTALPDGRADFLNRRWLAYTGLTAEQAAADFNGIMTELASQHEDDKGWTIYMVPLFQEIVGPVHKMLLVLLGAVGLVLLIACVNAANLLLAGPEL